MAENIDNIVRRILRSIRDGPEANNSDTSNASRPSTSVQPKDLQEELYARFDIPRSMPQPPASSTFTTASAVAQRFNPNSNYGYTGRSRRACSSASSSRPYPLNATSSGRSSYRNRGTRVEPPTLKEIILLPSPSTNIVPKYAAKADLHKRGFIMDMVPIERSWSESKIRDKIIEVFENVLRVKGDNVG